MSIEPKSGVQPIPGIASLTEPESELNASKDGAGSSAVEGCKVFVVSFRNKLGFEVEGELVFLEDIKMALLTQQGKSETTVRWQRNFADISAMKAISRRRGLTGPLEYALSIQLDVGGEVQLLYLATEYEFLLAKKQVEWTQFVSPPSESQHVGRDTVAMALTKVAAGQSATTLTETATSTSIEVIAQNKLQPGPHSEEDSDLSGKVCTFYSGRRTFGGRKQAAYYCYTCRGPSGSHCCVICSRDCHQGHNVKFVSSSVTFNCACGKGNWPQQCQSTEESQKPSEGGGAALTMPSTIQFPGQAVEDAAASSTAQTTLSVGGAVSTNTSTVSTGTTYRAVRLPNGRVYYYNIQTRNTQWDYPTDGEVVGVRTVK